MNTLEDRIRAAMEETAEEISPQGVPPLRLKQAGRRRLPGDTDPRRWAGWLAPLAAAAAVVAVIVASVAVSSTIGSGRPAAGTPGVLGGLPRYYVALRVSGHGSCCTSRQPLLPRTHAVVVDTATGAVLASLDAPPGDTFVGVTGAADDRTFVLGVQKFATKNAAPTRFYLLRISPARPRVRPRGVQPIPPSATSVPTGTIAPTGTPSPAGSGGTPSPAGSGGTPSPAGSGGTPSPAGSASGAGTPSPAGSAVLAGSRGLRARLSPLRILPDTSEMAGFALSPQGTSLAVLDLAGLHVVDLATGAQRTWDRPPCFAGSMLGGANTDAMLSWAADGQHLATACGSDPQRLIGVWLLDTTAPGGNLIKDSQRLVPGPVYGPNAQPPWNRVLLTRDGRTVIGVLEIPRGHRSILLSPMQELAEFSAQTGKLLGVLNRMPVWNYVDFEQVLWASPSGHSLLVSDTRPYHGKRRSFFLLNDAGVLTGRHFTPLRGWSLDTMAAAF